MTFGEYIRTRRKQLNITQKQVPGFDQGTISKMERGQNPTKREIILELATSLKLPLDSEYIDWLWMFSMLDRDPRKAFEQSQLGGLSSAYGVGREHGGEHVARELCLGMLPEQVQRVLGAPDDAIKFNNQEKWFYEQKAIHIMFTDGKVNDVIFK